jgi:hypothetical protein
MRARRWLGAVWLCFLARGLFYCAALPLWEGYDEWSHFAVVQRMAFRGEPMVARDAAIGQDVAVSLQLAPLPWELRRLGRPSVTHDAFWQLPAEERVRRERAFRAIAPEDGRRDAAADQRAYEGLQGPLYGWVMTPLLLAAGHAHLATQVLLLRVFGVLLVSLMIPLTLRIARGVFGEDAPALGCAALVAVMPEFLIDTARVGNDGIAALLFTTLIWLCVEALREGLSRGRAAAMGVVLGLGLLAKAYFLTALPPVAVFLLWKRNRSRNALLVPALAIAIAGWWYVRNQVTTGSFTGMWETALLDAGPVAQLREATKIPWGIAVDSILFSHLYLGGWSTLTVRSWMYHLFYLLIALGAVGQLVRRADAPARLLLAGFVLSFWLGQLYHVVPMFLVWAIPSSLGCYLYAVISAEVLLCTGGLRTLVPNAAKRFVAPAGVALFALLDLYTIHMIAIPYYTGLIAHRPGGPVAAFHPTVAALGEILPRLAAFKSPLLGEGTLAALWIAYAAATAALVGFSFAATQWGTSSLQSPPPPRSHSAAASPETAASDPTIPAPRQPKAAH